MLETKKKKRRCLTYVNFIIDTSTKICSVALFDSSNIGLYGRNKFICKEKITQML